MSPYHWTWLRGAAYLTRTDGSDHENAVNACGEREHYVAAVFPDDATSELVRWRVYVGKQRALPCGDIDGALWRVRTILGVDGVPPFPEKPLYPDHLITGHGGPLHRYLFIHKGRDSYAEALGRWPSKHEIILSEVMVDVRLWNARRVWYTHKAYQRKAKVQGPFIVSHLAVEVAACTSDWSGVVVVYNEHNSGTRRLPAHYCWPTEELAVEHAALLNKRKP